MLKAIRTAITSGQSLVGGNTGTVLITASAFVVTAMTFFAINGREPLSLFYEMVMGAFGDGYSFSETLVKAAPILLTALAVALPARLGLISVGGEGQLYAGALLGTGAVLAAISQPGWLLMPLMLAGAMAGGALWGVIPALLKTRLGVNETISTLLLNYVGILLVSYVVHGPWKNPASLGWPATIEFPEGAILPQFFGTRVHMGLIFGLVAAIILHVLVTYSRWGLGLRISRSNPRVAATAGISFERNVLIVMGRRRIARRACRYCGSLCHPEPSAGWPRQWLWYDRIPRGLARQPTFSPHYSIVGPYGRNSRLGRFTAALCPAAGSQCRHPPGPALHHSTDCIGTALRTPDSMIVLMPDSTPEDFVWTKSQLNS